MTSLVPQADEWAACPGGAGLQSVTCKPLSVMLVGAGRRGLGVHVPALAASRVLRLAAIVETPERMAGLRASLDQGVPLYDSLHAGLAAASPDLAIVATPHNSHVKLAQSLLAAKVPTLVEKPPARNTIELTELIHASKKHLTPLATILPLRYKPGYQEFIKWLRSPDLTDATVEITADVPSWPGFGNWRLSRAHAGGGVLIDLGYHYLDLVVANLGRPDTSSALLRIPARPVDAVEDEATVTMWFQDRRITVSIRVRSGAGLEKRSDLLIKKYGSVIYSSPAAPEYPAKNHARPERSPRGTDTLSQLDSLLRAGFLAGNGGWDESLDKQLQVMQLVDDLYATANHLSTAPERITYMPGSDSGLAIDGGRPVSAHEIHPVWPRVTEEQIDVLAAQARKALSVYDRSGIVQEFEDAFSAYVGIPYGLATSSGTAALHSIYYGAGIRPGDEVICCDYGFFATVAPLVHLGARPVLVDCSSDGTISVESAEAAITSRTRAIMVTHMWGQPGRLDELRALCDRKRLLLLEDCSHAHGARFKGSVVGSLGDAAAWSLQAHKTIWAGEGGVLGTKSTALFERALLLGHFNLRALQQIPESSPNFDLAFTGTGLKYRAHPLGLALALPQLSKLDQVIEGRQRSAATLREALSSIDGAQLLLREEDGSVHGYYALVALIDPETCGFDRDLFVRALQAENIYVASLPRQMATMSHHRLFQLSQPENEPPLPLDNSLRISKTAVNFFVPSEAADLTDATDVSVVADAIYKVAKGLPGRH